jgi:hypothetical protein
MVVTIRAFLGFKQTMRCSLITVLTLSPLLVSLFTAAEIHILGCVGLKAEASPLSPFNPQLRGDLGNLLRMGFLDAFSLDALHSMGLLKP